MNVTLNHEVSFHVVSRAGNKPCIMCENKTLEKALEALNMWERNYPVYAGKLDIDEVVTIRRRIGRG